MVMNSKEVYEELDRVYIKEEEEEIEHITFDDGRKKWDSTPTLITFEKDAAKCGEVMVACEGTFTFVCSLCLEAFGELQSFGSHIQDQHMHFEPKNAEIKKEKVLDPLLTTTEAAKPASSEGTSTASFGHKAIVTSLECVAQNTTQLDIDMGIMEEIYQDFEQLDSSNEGVSSSDEYVPPEKKFDDNKASTLKESFCVFCGRIYKDRRRFISHLKNVHKNEFEEHGVNENVSKKEPRISAPPTMTCKYCDQKFDEPSAFRAHVRTHTGPRRFVCPYCPKMFSSSYTRKSHINTHTGERPYKCTHCPKGFADATNLEMHVRTHLKIMKFSCDYCDKRFVQSTEKKSHERTHTGEKPFQCEECGRRFISHAKLTDHGRRHKNIKNYKCKLCDKAFYNSKLLKDHMVAHSSERPFHCNICGHNFPRRKSLRAHEQLHSNEKKYVCDTCGKAFAQCAGLYSHRKSHGEIPR